MIGFMAGVCYGSDISNDRKNYIRGVDCLNSQHGRTFEFPDAYVTIGGYSARVMREIYTHIGGSPTRVQASTRYIDYSDFSYFTPPSIQNNAEANAVYASMMDDTMKNLKKLEELKIPKEDMANGLPLGMDSVMVAKYNLRTLMDMSHQRKCTRAYHEFRKVFADLERALCEYSEQWELIVKEFFMPKCEFMLYCPEKFSCGKYPEKEVVEGLIKQWRKKEGGDTE